MMIKTTILCLPVSSLEKSLAFYKNALGIPDAQIDEGMIVLEIPNLSLFLMSKDAFETYTRKAGRETQLPGKSTGALISCAMESQEAVDNALASAKVHGGDVPSEPEMDAASGGYIGYFLDPDGHLWELVHPKSA